MNREDIEAFERFKYEYECEFFAPTHSRLRELAREYLKVTEDYDQGICAHRKGNIAIPVTSEERTLSTRFAEMKMREYTDRALQEGLLGDLSFREAVRREEREFDRTYRFTLTPHPKSPTLSS